MPVTDWIGADCSVRWLMHRAISCAANYILRWLLRTSARPGIGPPSLYTRQTVLWLAPMPRVTLLAPG